MLTLDATKEVVEFVQKEIIPVLNGQFKLSDKESCVMGTFFRMHALASSLTRLNNKLDFNAIAIIARTLFEVLIDLKLLIDASDKEIANFQVFKAFAAKPKLEQRSIGICAHAHG